MGIQLHQVMFWTKFHRTLLCSLGVDHIKRGLTLSILIKVKSSKTTPGTKLYRNLPSCLQEVALTTSL